MKRIALLFLVALGCVTLVHAQSSSNPTKMSGTVCDSSCIVQVDNASTCDKGCTVKSGEAVLVDDQGNVKRIANQNICKSHMGKHVTVMAVPSEQAREKQLAGQEQYFEVLQMEEQVE